MAGTNRWGKRAGGLLLFFLAAVLPVRAQPFSPVAAPSVPSAASEQKDSLPPAPHSPHSGIPPALFPLPNVPAAPPVASLPLEIPQNTVPRYSHFHIDFLVHTLSPQKIAVEGYETLNGVQLLYSPRIYTVDWIRHLYRVRITYQAIKTGFFFIGGLTVHTPEKEYRSDSKLLKIGEYRKGKTEVPLQVRWKAEDNFHLQKEAFPVALEVVDSPYLFLQNGKAEFKAVGADCRLDALPLSDGDRQIYERKEGPLSLYTYTLARFLVSFEAEGERFLPETDYASGDHWARAAKSPIKIVPLAEQPFRSRLIGKSFQYDFSLSDSQISEGETPCLLVTVSGTGNLHYPLELTPVADGLYFSPPTVSIRVRPTAEGYVGMQTLRWDLPDTECGSYKILLPKIKWLNVSQNSEGELKGGTLSLSVYPLAGAQSQEKPDLTFPLAGVDEMLLGNRKGMARQYENYFLYLPGAFFLLLSVLIRFGKRKKALPPTKRKFSGLPLLFLALIPFSFWFRSDLDPARPALQAATEAANQGNHRQAFEAFTALSAENPENAPLLYNLSLLSYRLGQKGDAVYYARQAVCHHPAKRRYREWNRFLEETYQLYYQYPLAPGISLDALFLINLIVFNAAALLLLVLSLLNQNSAKGRRIGGVWVALLLALPAATHVWESVVYLQREKQIAVVRQADSALLKIHQIEGEVLADIPEGTTVKVAGDYRDFYLVKTTTDLMGWIEKGRLRLPDTKKPIKKDEITVPEK